SAGLAAHRGRRQRFGELDVGGVIRSRAERDRILAGIREHVKFMRTGAADRAGIGGDRAKFKPQASEYARIGVAHIAIFALEVGVTRVKRIAVLHYEFAPAHDAEARPALV